MSGWNRPSEKSAKCGVRSAKRSAECGVLSAERSARKVLGAWWLVLGGVVALLGIGAYFVYFTDDSTPDSAPRTPHSALIREATPAAAPKPVEVKKSNAEVLRARFPGLKIPNDWAKPYPPQAYWPDGRLKEHSRYVRVITNKPTRASMSVEELTFKNHAERDIAGALLIDPGEELVGDYTYGESFVESFLESLKHPMVEDKDDTPFQKELRKAVEETKKELKQRYDAGEDLAAIMNETRKQMKELALYREEIRQMVEKAKAEHGDDYTEQEEKDLIDAANLMLQDRGCKPLELPHAFLEKIELENKEL